MLQSIRVSVRRPPGPRRRGTLASLRGSGPLVVALALSIGQASPAPGALPALAPPTAGDPLAPLLAVDDYETQRPDLVRELRRLQGEPCARLASFSVDRNDRIREHAVRLLDDAGCAGFESYRPFAADRSPWVTEAIVRAAERHHIVDAVPFLIDRLADRRTILSDVGARTVARGAHRALRAVTCQSFHFRQEGAAQAQTEAIASWRRWYEENRGRSRDAWGADGIALARADLASDDSARRIEGIELLALIGTPALPALRAGFERREQDLRATLSCVPDEPPRVTDQVPCVLLVTNLAKRRIALAPPPGDPEVRLTREDDLRATSRDDPGRPSRLAGVHPTDLVDRILDLAPGESLRREFKIGPVRAAGRYEVRATLDDLAAALGSAGSSLPAEVEPTPAPVPPAPRGRSAGAPKSAAPSRPAGPAPSVLPPIQATTVVRFEQ